jgi:hypothetical protein
VLAYPAAVDADPAVPSDANEEYLYHILELSITSPFIRLEHLRRRSLTEIDSCFIDSCFLFIFPCRFHFPINTTRWILATVWWWVGLSAHCAAHQRRQLGG